MILFVEIIYFYKKKIQNVELFCRNFVEFKNCRYNTNYRHLNCPQKNTVVSKDPWSFMCCFCL